MAETVNLPFPEHRIRSLIWAGARLLDPVGGGGSVGLDGSVTGRSVNWAYVFDRALASDDGRTTVIYRARDEGAGHPGGRCP